MPFPLPSIGRKNFARELRRLSPEPLDDPAVAALFAHYQELDLWNRKLSLIGPGTAEEILARHYGESLAALPLLPARLEGVARHGLDLGSGAGFPGLVLAAVRPDLEMTLVEAREKKWAFLSAVSRHAALPCRCLNVRVGVPLPAGLPASLDVVTARALKLEPEVLAALADRLAPGGRILLWAGEAEPDLPPGLSVAGGKKLEGSERRRILVVQRSSP
jgi:16S rRNA (guanine527-N7)-methyltransferase